MAWVWVDDHPSDDLDAPLILNGEFMDPTVWDTIDPPF